MTLTEFLLARIAEDEQSVEVPDWRSTDSARGEGWGSRGDECPACGKYMFDGTEAATEDEWENHMADAHGRVLAECAAKRRIIEKAVAASEAGAHALMTDSEAARDYAFDEVLEILALPYSDHPDYRDEWKP